MLRKTRSTCALVVFVLITRLFLDFTGTLRTQLGWLAKIQFLPAVLALNIGVIAFSVVLTLVFGRIYCSIICPLGVFQDIVSWVSERRKKKHYCFSYSPKIKWLRYGVFIPFVIALIAGIDSLVALLASYSSYGRVVQNLFQPIYIQGNNLLVFLAERTNSYTFYGKDVWLCSLPAFIIAAISFVTLAVLVWLNERTYCSTVCPVDTMLGFISRFSLLHPVPNVGKYTKYSLCVHKYKATCIDCKSHKVDYSRCVACMDCIDTYQHDALHLQWGRNDMNRLNGDRIVEADATKPIDTSRRTFLIRVAVTMITTAWVQRKEKIGGGLTVIEDKIAPRRTAPITPPGSLSAENMARYYTACQLYATQYPNDALRPSTGLMKLMQPTMSFERGYCHPGYTRCSNVCPTGTIRPITHTAKSATQIGHAVWTRKNCIPFTDGVEYGNCTRHCPVSAVTMIPNKTSDPKSPKILAVSTERYTGCEACEDQYPARPFSAIHIEGYEMYRIV